MLGWMSCHSEQPKYSWEAWQPVMELMCPHPCLWMSVRTLHIPQLSSEARDGGWGEGCSDMNGQSLSGRHIEWSHMASTHSVMRVSRPCCFFVDWGLQGQTLHFTFWCQWTASLFLSSHGVRDVTKRSHHPALFCFTASQNSKLFYKDRRYDCWTVPLKKKSCLNNL